MTQMVERVALAAFERWAFESGSFNRLPQNIRDHWRCVARAAIEAAGVEKLQDRITELEDQVERLEAERDQLIEDEPEPIVD